MTTLQAFALGACSLGPHRSSSWRYRYGKSLSSRQWTSCSASGAAQRSICIAQQLLGGEVCTAKADGGNVPSGVLLLSAAKVDESRYLEIS